MSAIIRSDRRDEGEQDPPAPMLPPLRKFLVTRYHPPTQGSPLYTKEDVLVMGHSIDLGEAGSLIVNEIRLLNGTPAIFMARVFGSFFDVQEVDYPGQVKH